MTPQSESTTLRKSSTADSSRIGEVSRNRIAKSSRWSRLCLPCLRQHSGQRSENTNRLLRLLRVSHGQPPFTKLNEIRASVEDGAQEIDIVISRHHVLTGNWTALYDEVAAFKKPAGKPI